MIIEALDKNGVVIKISEIEKGIKKELFCKNCHNPLVAKKGNIRKHHFMHAKGFGDCGYSDKEENEEKRTYNSKPKTEEATIEKHDYICKETTIEETFISPYNKNIYEIWNYFQKPFIAQNNLGIYIIINENPIGKTKSTFPNSLFLKSLTKNPSLYKDGKANNYLGFHQWRFVAIYN